MKKVKSEIKILYASRYGSTKQIAEMLAERLGAEASDVKELKEVPEGFLILGSGIYSHRYLPEMESFIQEHREVLLERRLAMFGVAMKIDAIKVLDKSFGGEGILDLYSLNPVMKGMLHGRMDFSALTDKDRAGLERFYESIGLSDEQKSDRRKLRDRISPQECDQYASKVMETLIK